MCGPYLVRNESNRSNFPMHSVNRYQGALAMGTIGNLPPLDLDHSEEKILCKEFGESGFWSNHC